MGPSSHPRCYPGRLLYRAWKVLTCDLTARSQPEAAKGEALHRSRLPKAGITAATQRTALAGDNKVYPGSLCRGAGTNGKDIITDGFAAVVNNGFGMETANC